MGKEGAEPAYRQAAAILAQKSVLALGHIAVL